MSTTIRLRRVGRKKQPSYRLVVVNKSAPPDGGYIERLGYYNPRREPAHLEIDLEKVDYWVGTGAEISSTAKSLISKARRGGDASVAVVTGGEPPAGATAAPAEAEEEAEPEAEAEAEAPEAEQPEAEAPEAKAEAPAAEEAEEAEETAAEAEEEPEAEAEEEEPKAEASAEAEEAEEEADEESEEE